MHKNQIILLIFVIVEWINGYKAVIEVITGIELGNPRPPLKSLTLEQRRKLKTKLILKNWIL